MKAQRLRPHADPLRGSPPVKAHVGRNMRQCVPMLVVLCATCGAAAPEKVRTRAELLASVQEPGRSPLRYMCEVDLNSDGTNDLILSESVSMGGTGGLVYNLYLGLGDNRFGFLDRFLAGVMAIEIVGETKRLWSYSHSSAGSGTVEYRYFDRKGVFQRSSPMEILAGDGGSEMGNAVFAAIFSGKTRLQMKALGAPDAP